MTGQSILLAEDDLMLADALVETLSLEGYDVCAVGDGEAALQALNERAFSAVISDYQMKPMDGYTLLARIRETQPGLPVLLMTAHGTIRDAVRAMQVGATDYLSKPFEPATLLKRLASVARPQSGGSDGFVAEDPAMLEVLSLARKIAASDVAVLLTGESGTGKEVLARFIHANSPVCDGPFVAINCAAIPENMLEAMLFGHERGAFTGAHEARAGKFEQAQGGILLLDEVSEMDLGLQAKLLRVLQEREVERIGGRSPIALNVRVIATSNRDLAELAGSGRFRADLYYRLSVFPLALPALRERRHDILPLAGHFLAAACEGRRTVPRIGAEVAEALVRHAWPGNVRELQNVIERGAILCSGNTLEPADLRLVASTGGPQPTEPEKADGPAHLQDSMQSVEGQLIIDAIRRGGGSRKRAAQLLGISPRTLRYKIARLRDAGIRIPAGMPVTQ